MNHTYKLIKFRFEMAEKKQMRSKSALEIFFKTRFCFIMSQGTESRIGFSRMK